MHLHNPTQHKHQPLRRVCCSSTNHLPPKRRENVARGGRTPTTTATTNPTHTTSTTTTSLNPQLSEEGCRDCSSPASHRFPRSFTSRGCNFFRCRGAILCHRFKAIETRRWRAERVTPIRAGCESVRYPRCCLRCHPTTTTMVFC